MTAGDPVARARQLVELGRWPDAQRELALALSREPACRDALCLLAQCRLELGDPAGAAEHAGAVLARAPDDEWALRLRSIACTRLGRHEEAVAAAEAAVRSAAGQPAAHSTLAEALRQAPGRQREALAPAREAVRLAPLDPDAHLTLGLALGARRRTREERAAYERALSLEPEHAFALNNLAALDIDRGRLTSGTRRVLGALRADPHQPVLQANLDAIGVRLLARLLNAMLLTGFLLFFASLYGPWWARAATGVFLFVTYGLIAWSTLRHLPPGARHHLRSLPRRMSRRQRLVWAALLTVSVALVVLAFAPNGISEYGGVLFVVIVRVFQVLLVVSVARWAVAGLGRARPARLRRRLRRGANGPR